MHTSILAEAESITQGDRHCDYGDSNENFRCIAAIAKEMGVNVSGGDVIKILMAVKLGRHKFKAKRDNLVDLAGYAECLARWESQLSSKVNLTEKNPDANPVP